MDMQSAPIYEFLLWNNCNNNCKFCHQKANREKYPGKFTDDFGKHKSISLVSEFIQAGSIAPGSHFLLMGGELFDTKLSTRTEAAFLHLAIQVKTMMLTGLVGYFYLNSNLLYEDRTLLDKFLAIFKEVDLLKRVLFTTSYDFGPGFRFESKKDRAIAESNMLNISRDYPDMRRTANCILTAEACTFLSNNREYLGYFKQEFGFDINLIPYIRLGEGMAATRSTILSTLMDLDITSPGILERVKTTHTASPVKILWEFDGENLAYVTAKNANCGHSINFTKVYSDSVQCFICDIIQIYKLTYQSGLK